MNKFEMVRSMNIDELAEWFTNNWLHDNDPVMSWWDNKYCNKCESVIVDGCEYAWCEVHHKCRYFQDIDDIPNCKQTVKLWLESGDGKEN